MRGVIIILLVAAVVVFFGGIFFMPINMSLVDGQWDYGRQLGIPILSGIGLYFLALILAIYQIITSKEFTLTQKLLFVLLICCIHVIGLIIYLILGEKMVRENKKEATVNP